jgi:hypothetical protein
MSLKSLFILTALSATLSQVTLAAVPPLSQSVREQIASEIVTGTVLTINEETVDLKYGTNKVYTVQMQSDAGEYITFTFWKATQRPTRWAGPSGQYGEMNVGDTIRAYLSHDAETGTYKLLTPNGFDRL